MASYFEREFKRKDGTTYKRWCGEEKIDGKSKTVYGKTRKECKAKIEALMSTYLSKGKLLDKNNITVEAWVHNYLFTIMLTQLSSSTFEVYMYVYNNHVKDTPFGQMKLQAVKLMDLTQYFNSKSIYSKGWMVKIKNVLNGAFKSAKLNELIFDNPFNDFKLPQSKVAEKDVKVFTIDEQKEYINHLTSSTIDTLLLTALYTGLRVGELISLKWSNYDGEYIYVRESSKYSRVYEEDGTYTSKVITKEPKTRKSIREVPLPYIAKVALEKLDKSTSYIFASKADTILNTNNIRRRHMSICERAELPSVSLHGLRHTYATRLIELQENPRTVQELLGHSDVRTTLDIYTAVFDSTKQKAVSKLDLL